MIFDFRFARSIVITSWALATSLSITPVFWNKWEENVEENKWKGKCEFGYVVVPLYVKTIYLPSCFLLFTIMWGFYIKIFTETRKHTKRMRHAENDPPDTWKSVQVFNDGSLPINLFNPWRQNSKLVRHIEPPPQKKHYFIDVSLLYLNEIKFEYKKKNRLKEINR